MKKFEVGQVWRRRDGVDVTIVQVLPEGVLTIHCDDGIWRNPFGKFCEVIPEHKYDLVTLIGETPASPEPVNAPPATEDELELFDHMVLMIISSQDVVKAAEAIPKIKEIIRARRSL